MNVGGADFGAIALPWLAGRALVLALPGRTRCSSTEGGVA